MFLAWHWKHTARTEYIKCIIWLFVLKASFLPLFFSSGCSAHTWIALSYLFICQPPSVFYPSFPLLTFFLVSCNAFSPHAVTTGIDQTSVSKMMIIIHTTVCCYCTTSPLISICHPSVYPSFHPSMHFLLNVILLPQHSHMGSGFTSLTHHK